MEALFNEVKQDEGLPNTVAEGENTDGTTTPNSLPTSTPENSNRLPTNTFGNTTFSGGWIKSSNFATGSAGWRLTAEGIFEAQNGIFRGNITAETGNIGGWVIGLTTLKSTLENIVLDSDNETIDVGGIKIDGANEYITNSNFATGVSGWRISDNVIEVQNLIARGNLTGSVFTVNIKSAVGGQLIVANADSLASDMTALDASTLTIKGGTTFSVNDMIVLRGETADGIEEERLRITNIGSAPTYSVTRDLAGLYGADDNPVWKAGTPVITQGLSNGTDTYSGGWLELVGSGTNSPYYSVYQRTGLDWDDFTETCRLGNLNGFLDYTTDKFGIGIGDSTRSLTYNTTEGLLLSEGFVAGEDIDEAVPVPVYINTLSTSAEAESVAGPTSGAGSSITYLANYKSQSFVMGLTKNKITKVGIYCAKIGSPTGTFTVNLYEESGDLQTGASLGTATKDSSTFAGVTSLQYIVFATPIDVIPGKKYVIVCSLPSGSTLGNNITVSFDNSSDTYTGGKFATSPDSGANWSFVNYDMCFKIYGTYVEGATAGEIMACDDRYAGKLAYTGMLVNSVDKGDDAKVMLNGVVSGYTGLTVGATYYLDVSKANFIHTSAGVNSVKVGRAITSTRLLIYQLAI
jgi:hypothetical protein